MKKLDPTPYQRAQEMISKLGGEVSANREALKMRHAATSNARREYWSAVLRAIETGAPDESA